MGTRSSSVLLLLVLLAGHATAIAAEKLPDEVEDGASEVELGEGSGLQAEPSLGRPANLTATQVSSRSMFLKWEMSTSYNNIKGYRMFYRHNGYSDVKTFDQQKPEYLLQGLEPYTKYDIWVVAVGGEVEGPPSAELPAVTDTEAPSAPFITNATCYESLKIYLEWKKPKTIYKQIDYYYIYYRPAEPTAVFRHHQIQGNSDDDQKFFLEKVNSELRPSEKYIIKICAGTKSIKTDQIFKGDFSDEVEVYLNDSGCGFNLLAPALSSDLSVGILVGAVAALLLLLLTLIGFIVWKRHSDSSYCYLEDPPKPVQPVGIPDWEGEPGPDGEHGAVHVADFAAHVARLHADSDIGFSREYNEILRYSTEGVVATHEHSSHPDNKHKNRYLNIVAYDHSRVQLSVAPGQKKTTDYINANFIDGFQQFQAYIGSQGPLDDTFESFWRMVWEQRVHVIVMITNLVERSRRKCDQYWPKEGTLAYGLIEVTLVSEVVMANYTLRSLRLKHRKLKKKKWICSERSVWQYHYTAWPDHGTPPDTLPVLSFIRKSVAAASGAAAAADGSGGDGNSGAAGGPIVVHCSAGVGRTGTYIVIDAMLRQAAAKGEMNIFGYLKHIRSQRNHLVQTEEQYIFLHDALVEALSSGVTEVPLSGLSAYITDLTSSLSGLTCETLLEKQYGLVSSFTPGEYDLLAARKPVNAAKNRNGHLVPVEVARVPLTPRPGIDGSDYINATWLQGYEKVKEFIVTQHPTAETRDAFWTMLWDHNAQTVVLLTPTSDEEDLPVFWPGPQEEYDQESFKVRFIEEGTHQGHTTLDFLVASRHDDYELKARIIHCPGWPYSSRSTASPGLLYTVLDVVGLVQDWHLEYQNGPLVVVDRYGGTEAATFCALTTLQKQIARENTVDVYQICKLYHNKRPGVWRDQEDYLYIYRVLESLASREERHGEHHSRHRHPGAADSSESTDSGNLIERRHSSEWRGSNQAVLKITMNRRHSLPDHQSANGHVVNKAEKSSCCILDLGTAMTSQQQSPDSSSEPDSSGGGMGLRLLMRSGSSPQGSAEMSNPGTGSTAVLVTEELIQVSHDDDDDEDDEDNDEDYPSKV